MDLSTMSAKLEAGSYADRFAFEEDVHLTVRNAKVYNPPASFAHGDAVALDDFFRKRK